MRQLEKARFEWTLSAWFEGREEVIARFTKREYAEAIKRIMGGKVDRIDNRLKHAYIVWVQRENIHVPVMSTSFLELAKSLAQKWNGYVKETSYRKVAAFKQL